MILVFVLHRAFRFLLWIFWEVRPEGPFLSAQGETDNVGKALGVDRIVSLVLRGPFGAISQGTVNLPFREKTTTAIPPRASSTALTPPWAGRNGPSGRTSQKIQSKKPNVISSLRIPTRSVSGRVAWALSPL